MGSPEERFNGLFTRTHAALLAYALRRVDDPGDAAEIVAETFLVAWRRIDSVPAGDDARPWLFGVARRVLANHRRGERRRAALTEKLRLELREVTVPAPEVVDHDLAAAMAMLSPDDRELLRLLAWEELDRDQIAAALGISKGTARVRIHRARQRLEKALEKSALKRSAPPGQVSDKAVTAAHTTRGVCHE